MSLPKAGRGPCLDRLPFDLSRRVCAPELPPALREEHARAGLALPSAAAGKAQRNPTPIQRFLHRASMGWTLRDEADVKETGYRKYLERQLDHEAIDDSPLEDALRRALPTLSMSTAEIIRRFRDEDQGMPAVELILATFFRSVYSPRQLYERMVVFWSDHFHVSLESDFSFLLKPADDREVARKNALGKFSDLLAATAHSPAMLVYLSNATNVKGAPNENYARELMELHTMGADNGYTQEDVREVARCFTGWTIGGFGAGGRLGEFHFAPQLHDRGRKVVLGQVIPAGGGVEDGLKVLEILADRPETADFISRKMMRYLWGYEPPEWRVKRVADVYLESGGDIREMLRLILRQAWMEAATPKLKRPYHLFVSAIRALGAEITDPGHTFAALNAAGHLPFIWGPPNGYPDSEAYWSGLLVPRWSWAATFFEGARVDIPALDPARNPELTRAQVRGRLDRQLLGRTMSDETRAALAEFMAPPRPFNLETVAETASLVLSSPEFQNY